MTEAILRLQHVEFEGAGSYTRPTGAIPLAKQGKVLISGEEGAGKSMVPEVPTLVLYGKGSPRIGDKGLKESLIVNQATGYRGKLAFESGAGASQRNISITQAFNHKREGSRYVISIDGKRDEDMPLKKPEQKKLVKKLAPLSYEEWMGVVYLHQGGLHDLLTGGPSDKRAYLTSVFGLDFYDDLLAETVAENARLTKTTYNVADLERQRADLDEEIAKVEESLAGMPDRSEISGGVEKLSSRLQAASEDIGRLEALRSSLERRRALELEVKDYPWGSKAKTEKALAGFKADLESLRERIAKLKARREAAADAQAAGIRAQKNLTKATEGFNQAAHAVKLAEADYERKAQAAAGLPPPEKLAAQGTLIQDALERRIDVLDLSEKKPSKDWKADAKKAAIKQGALTELATLLTAHTGGDCPTCKRALSTEELQQRHTDAETEYRVPYSKACAAVAAMLKEAGLAVAHGQSLTQARIEVMQQAAVVYQTGMAMMTIQGARQQLEESHHRLVEAQEAVGALPLYVDPDELSKDISELNRRAGDLSEEVGLAEQAIHAFTQLEALKDLGDPGQDVDDQIQAAKDKKARINTKYRDALSMLQAYDQAAATRKALRKQRADLDQKLQDVADTVEKIKLYDDILIPFFTSLRASKVHSCVGVLEGVLPVYMRAMSSGQYEGAEVRLEVSDDLSNINLMLRPSAFSPQLLPIQASGGQRQRFSLAMFPALYEVAPRKANVLFLDEPFGHMQSEGKEMALNHLFPLMMERCPSLESLFIIAHDHEIIESAADSFDSVWTVTRGDSGSSISRKATR